MKIEKVLNNSAAVIQDDKGNEKIVVGKGICFQKKPGDQIYIHDVEKTFYMSSPNLNLKFQQLLVQLPMEQLSLVETIINMTKLELGRKISDSIYISLTDHIHFSLKNHEQGIHIKNAILWDIKRFYPDEYKIGKKALLIIEQNSAITLPDDEAGFIALHIVNASIEEGTKDIYKATRIIDEILTLVKYFFVIDMDVNSLNYYRFVSHLRFFSTRIVNDTIFRGDENDEELLDMIKLKYESAYECVLKIEEFLLRKYHVDIASEEKLFLCIHIQRAVFKE